MSFWCFLTNNNSGCNYLSLRDWFSKNSDWNCLLCSQTLGGERQDSDDNRAIYF